MDAWVTSASIPHDSFTTELVDPVRLSRCGIDSYLLFIIYFNIPLLV